VKIVTHSVCKPEDAVLNQRYYLVIIKLF